jgi:hypothetical protein
MDLKQSARAGTGVRAVDRRQFISALAASAAVTNRPQEEILFNGADTGAWQTVGGDAEISSCWRVTSDGALVPVLAAQARDLRTRALYRDFELSWDWASAEKGNGGIKYRIVREGGGRVHLNRPELAEARHYGVFGLEYQMADDEGEPDARSKAVSRTGALYGLIEPRGARPAPLGELNHSRIVLRGLHGEHWLNGAKVVEYDLGGAEMRQLARRFPERAELLRPEPFDSPIVLQHHFTTVFYRNIRIRTLSGGEQR